MMNPKIKIALKDPYFACELVLNRLARFIDDEHFIKWKYYLNFRKKLDLDNPQTFNEKLQWLKLYDRREEYTQMVDKYEAKKLVANLIGEEYIIPTLGVYDSFDEIDFDKLPNQFVLKCTHNSGGIIICRDKASLDIPKARKRMTKWLKKNPFWSNREWPYKNVKPRIIAERFFVDESGTGLKDYKFYCFNGIPRVLLLVSNRGEDTRFDFFDMDYKHLEIVKTYPNADVLPLRPKCFDEMIVLCKKMSANKSFVRIDFYNINHRPYFGEFTFFPSSGLSPWNPEIWNEKLGSWIFLGG